MPVYFLDNDAVHPPLINVRGPLARHLARALRAQPGELLRFVAPSGRRYLGRLTSVSPSAVAATILCDEPPPPPLRPVFVAQSVLKGPHMDWALQKATELGATTIMPLVTARTIVRPRRERTAAQMARWRSILHDAAQQSGRNEIPVLADPVDFAAGLSMLPPDAGRLVLWEGEEEEMLARRLMAMPAAQPIALLAGPEGGFTAGEITVCREHGVRPVSLGPLTVRAETATLAALTIIQAVAAIQNSPSVTPRPARHG